MLRVGQKIDRFTIDAILGEGGMAVVYKVHHTTLGTIHAMKLLKYGDEDVQRRLVAEGQMQAALKSPNILAVSDVLAHEDMPCLLMEFIEGPSLEDWLSKHVVSVSEALAIFRGVLAGVACAHRAGLIHRDLKPGNVLLAPVAGMVVPKVADFGLAKVMGSSAGATRSATGLGTPHFMAPEQIRNAKHVDQRADIFSLGCILYHLVCGTRPFNQKHDVDVYGAICSATYVDPAVIQPDLPVPIVNAIRGCLVVDAAARIASCEALFNVLYPGEQNVFAAPPVQMGPAVSTQAKATGRPVMELVAAETRMPGQPAAAKFAPPGGPVLPKPGVDGSAQGKFVPRDIALPGGKDKAGRAPADDAPTVQPLLAVGLAGVAVAGLVLLVLLAVIVGLMMREPG